MRKRFPGLLLAAALTCGASAVQAAPFTGTFVFALGTLSPVVLPGAGTGDPSLPSISANSFLGTGSSPVTGVAPVTQIFVSIAGNASGAVGSGPSISGTVLAAGSGFGTALPLVGVPLTGRLGFASAVLAPLHSGGSGSISAHFGAWTTGLATVMRTHTLSSAPCVASANSPSCPSAALGAATANIAFFGGAAQLVLVAPTDIYTTTGGIAGIPSFSVMALNYVPEPSSLILLVSGAVTLGLAGRRRL